LEKRNSRSSASACLDCLASAHIFALLFKTKFQLIKIFQTSKLQNSANGIFLHQNNCPLTIEIEKPPALLTTADRTKNRSIAEDFGGRIIIKSRPAQAAWQHGP
jgi:hypothetical protein